MSPAKVTPIQCNIRKEEEVTTNNLLLGLNTSGVYCVCKSSDPRSYLLTLRSTLDQETVAVKHLI